MTDMPAFLRRCALAAALGAWASLASAQAPRPPAARSGDYILAVVNQELVTAGELEQRVARIRAEATRSGTPLPPLPQLRQQVFDSLIDERVQVTNARDSGYKVDDAEIERAVGSVALQNKITVAQLRQKLQQEGIDFQKFRGEVRDQIMTERVREREVMNRIKVTDAEIDALIAERRAAAGAAAQLNLAQILVTVPDGADIATVAERRRRAEAARARVLAGESFEAVSREISEDGNRAQGGVMGLRPADRLPDVFVNAVRGLRTGDVAPELLRTDAGFHLLKVIERQDPSSLAIQQTRARHILLRVSPQLPQEGALRRLAEIKRTIAAGTKTFEQAARENSEDASAPQGGDLGWVSPGTFVPEFEEVVNGLAPSAISDPFVSRFGVHLVQVLERRQVTLDVKQQREQARNILREQKFDEAYAEWIRDLRSRAYVELREPPN
jgi:peptidyl-prolyl cis-trans isomerase SurA